METIKTLQKTRFVKTHIPEELVYETINGKPIYYNGYKEVINQHKQITEIMGSSNLQAIIINNILMYLYDNIDRKKYYILTNELGLHLNSKNNIAADIAIFERTNLFSKTIKDKYVDIPPKIIIEIDTKADLTDFDNVMDYYQTKTTKLFNFGVEKVFWILTKNKQIIEAVANKQQLIHTWNKEIHLFDNMKFSLNQLLKDDEIYEFIY